MPIPKIIHLCWLGGSAPDKNIKKCAASHAKLLDAGYEIHIWNEDNYDLNASPAVAQAYRLKKWSLVSNYMRVDILERYGGIYLNTDIEIVKTFDDLLGYDFFIGFMWDCNLGTAVIGSAPGHKVVRDIKRAYDSDAGNLTSPNNDTFTKYFLNDVPEFVLNGKSQAIDNMVILDKFYFEHPSPIGRKNYTIHHFMQSWKGNSKLKILSKRLIVASLSLKIYRLYVCWHSRRISDFYPIFREHMHRKYHAMPRK